MKTYYQVLGVPETATEQEIKKAFRAIAKANHPDTHPGDSAAEERFKAANEAYETLSDTGQREKYDTNLKMAPTQKKVEKSSAVPVDFGNRNFGDMFENMFQEMDQEQSKTKQTKVQSKKDKEKSDDPLNVDNIFAKFMGFKP